MRVTIPDFKTKAELFKYLIDNKKKLIDLKKSVPIYADCVSFKTTTIHEGKQGVQTKDNAPVTDDVDMLRVKVVANTANWIDSHVDMLLPDSALKSINERKGIIPHLHDHIHQIEAKVGEVKDILLSNLSFSELGINGFGSTQAIVFITDVIKSYNEKVFNQYKLGKINQHSIGLQYVKLDLAINDESSEKEFDFWNKYYPQVINKDAADERGFFWVVQEIKLIENSAVLFGSNIITPTLDNNLKNESLNGPQKDEPQLRTQKEDFFNW
jgi:hypothetical protein